MKNYLQTDNYHVHVYYESHQLNTARDVRIKIMRDMPELGGVGVLRDQPIGPHPLPMFEAWFSFKYLEKVIEWMKQNGEGLSIMFHPLSGNDLEDHKIHSWWIGKKLPLRLEIFK